MLFNPYELVMFFMDVWWCKLRSGSQDTGSCSGDEGCFAEDLESYNAVDR